MVQEQMVSVIVSEMRFGLIAWHKIGERMNQNAVGRR
jgi:hypothetical protein